MIVSSSHAIVIVLICGLPNWVIDVDCRTYEILFWYCWVSLALRANVSSGYSVGGCKESTLWYVWCFTGKWEPWHFFNSFKCNVGRDGEAEFRVWPWGDRITMPPYSIREHPRSWACELSRLLWYLLHLPWPYILGGILSPGCWCCNSSVLNGCKLRK